IPANASTQAATSHGVVLFQNRRNAPSRLPYQRVNATATPSARSRHARNKRRLVKVSQSYMLRNVSRKTNTRIAGIRGVSPDTTMQNSASERKSIASTQGEIQTISQDTCIMGPHRAQLILWKSSSPRPSMKPTTIPEPRPRIKTEPAFQGATAELSRRSVLTMESNYLV